MRLGAEDLLQKMCVNWFRIQFPKYILFSVPNGSDVKSHCVRTLLKMTGLLKGAPDLVCALPNKIMFIEMKKPATKKYNHKTGNWNKKPGGKQSPEQKEFQEKAENLGHPYHVVDNLDDFQKIIKEALDNPG